MLGASCTYQMPSGNGVADRMTFAVADVFDGVEGDFDLIVFDPPFPLVQATRSARSRFDR
jgi:methylase of polypeptide subunit release factors